MKVEAYVWNEHEEPLEVPSDADVDLVQKALLTLLEVKEYGSITRTYPERYYPSRDSTVPSDSLTLYYRAFDDPFRGRQIISGISLAELDKLFQERKRQCAFKVFSPSELYALKPTRVDYDSWHTISVHLTEEVPQFDIDLDEIGKMQRFETRTLVDYCSDGRRTWTLQTVWFDNKPVMVVNSSGRDGDEYHERWITDIGMFHSMVEFLKTFVEQAEERFDYAEASDKIPAMTEFYGGTIHDFYDVETGEPRKQ